MSFVPKKIVEEEGEVLNECHINKAAAYDNKLYHIYDNDTVSHLPVVSEWMYFK